MRKLYNKFFRISKHEKISDKVMLVRAAMAIIFVITSLVAMSFSAYAYFSCSVSSATNIIKAADFVANISINNGSVTTTKSQNTETVQLTAGEYTIDITKGDCSAQTGFCIITIDNADYYTSQIGVDTKQNKTDASVKFRLKVSADTKLEILSHWGTSSCYQNNETDSDIPYIKNNDLINLTASSTAVKEKPSVEKADKAENTTSSEPSITTESTVSSTETPSSEASQTGEQSEKTESSSEANTSSEEDIESAETKPTDTTESTETQSDEENADSSSGEEKS